MFTWAIIDYTYSVLNIQKATLDVPTARPGEWWVIIDPESRYSEGLIYNPDIGTIENG